MYKEHFQKAVDEEINWEKEEAKWITAFKKTDHYAKLLEEYDHDSVEKGVRIMAEKRTRIYRKGPAQIQLKELNKRKEVLPQGYTFLRVLLRKKWFDIQLKWYARQIEVDGIYFPNQFKFFGDDYVFSHPLVSPISMGEIEFLKELLLDDEFIRCEESLDWFLLETDTEIRDWLKTRNADEVYPPRYPMFYRKYDEWFGQQHLLVLPQTRLEKYHFYNDVLHKALHPDAVPWIDPNEGKLNFASYEYDLLVSEWFRKHEPAEMAAWYEATYEMIIRQKVTDRMEIYDAMDALTDHPVKIYPDGSLRWDKALIFAGKSITYKKIADHLDFVLEQYEDGLRKKKNPLLESSIHKTNWDFVERVYKRESEDLFAAQALLNEPQTLHY